MPAATQSKSHDAIRNATVQCGSTWAKLKKNERHGPPPRSTVMGVFDSGLRMCREKVHAERQRFNTETRRALREDLARTRGRVKPDHPAQILSPCPRCLCGSLPLLRVSARPFLAKTSSSARHACFPRTAVRAMGELARVRLRL